MKFFLSSLLLLTAATATTASANLRGDSAASRQLQGYYFSTTDTNVLGKTNKGAVLDNPMKGLLTSPRYTGHNTPDTPVPSTLEFYYIGLDELMFGPNEYNWSVLEEALAGAEAKNMHVVLRVFLHYPDQPLRVPSYLMDQIELRTISSGETSPQYDDPTLLTALEQFIGALGEKYDGHKSLAFIQLGLLGKWGEWHTYPDEGLLSEETKDKVVGWYTKAFQITPLQIRNPLASAYQAGIGLHDDSFGFSTLDGPANGGEEVDWFFWPEVKAAGQEDFWRNAVMGGETRPEIQGEIFETSYKAGTSFKQDFFECVDVTHATYMFHHNAFKNGDLLSGNELSTALDAHVSLGYSFRVTEVAAIAAPNQKVTVDVTVEQIGVAPFYYPLNLVLSCDGTSASADGVENLVDTGDKNVFRFTNIPADSQCLNNVEITLDSPRHVHAGRPVRFAQGDDGRVILELPVPLESQEEEATDPPVKDEPNDSPADPDTEGPQDSLPAEDEPNDPPADPGTEESPADPDTEEPGDLPTITGNDAEIFVDAGPENEDLSIVSGSFWQHYADVSITNSAGYSDEIFKTHRWGSDFMYTFSGLTPGSMKDITLGFAETYNMACTNGGRVMDIQVSGEVFADSLDVFSEVGCQTVFLLTKTFEVNAQGELAITFMALADNAMVSLIQIDDNQDAADDNKVAADGKSFWAWIINLFLSIWRGGGGGGTP